MDRRAPKNTELHPDHRDFTGGPAIWSVVWFLLKTAVQSVIGYVAVYLFRPVWEWIMKKWKSRKQKNIEVDIDSIEE